MPPLILLLFASLMTMSIIDVRGYQLDIPGDKNDLRIELLDLLETFHDMTDPELMIRREEETSRAVAFDTAGIVNALGVNDNEDVVFDDLFVKILTKLKMRDLNEQEALVFVKVLTYITTENISYWPYIEIFGKIVECYETFKGYPEEGLRGLVQDELHRVVFSVPGEQYAMMEKIAPSVKKLILCGDDEAANVAREVVTVLFEDSEILEELRLICPFFSVSNPMYESVSRSVTRTIQFIGQGR